MTQSYIQFIDLIFNKVETNFDNKNYIKEALPYLKSLLESIQILRGQFFVDTDLRPTNYNLVFLSEKEEYFLMRYERIKKNSI
jgi:hypothetical protein